MTSSSDQPPSRSLQNPTSRPGERSPSALFVQSPGSPDAHDRQGGSPRISQLMIGITAMRSPGFTLDTPEPVSITSPTISCPITFGNETNGESAGLLVPWRSDVSLPQMPQSLGRTRNQSGPGSGFEATSASFNPGTRPRSSIPRG